MPKSAGTKGSKKKLVNANDANDGQSTSDGAPAPLLDEEDHLASSAGQSSVMPVSGNIDLDEFNGTLQKRIVEALCTPEVVEVITKAVSEAILDSVTQRVYESIDHDIQSKMSLIKKLEKQLQDLQHNMSKATLEIEELEAYSRRNCLRIQGLPESPTEKTDDVALKLIQERLGIDLLPSDIDRSHRLFPRHHESSHGPKPLLVKFARYNVRDKVYRARTKLRGSNIFINEHLTRNRQTLFSRVRDHKNVRKAWTNDGRITALTTDSRRVKVMTEPDLEKL